MSIYPLTPSPQSIYPAGMRSMDNPADSLVSLSTKEQWHLNVADELFHAGFVAAAGYLRGRIPSLRGVWEAEARAAAATTNTHPTNLFRIHHGSTPPTDPQG